MALNIKKGLDFLEQTAARRRGGLWLFVLAILHSRYFLISMVFYLSLLLIFSGYVISTYLPVRGSFEGVDQLLVLPPAGKPPPPPPKQKTTAETKEVKRSPESTRVAATRLTVSKAAAPTTYVKTKTPQVAPTVNMAEVKIETDMTSKIKAANIARLQGVRKFQKSWGVTGSKRRVKAKFTIFKAKYQDGDWNCNPEDLNNLMLQIRAWSRARIDANLHPAVLDVGTDQLFTMKPPFIYLTGHKDFRFKENEVKNIRDYLMLGGAVWADSALAGRRSRFDIAFRREMKRVLPDREFEDIKPDHEMFDTFFEHIGMPSGMNYYEEPIEMITIGNELAVLYTKNGYGHFWESRLDRKGKIEYELVSFGTNSVGKTIWKWVYGPHLGHPRTVTGTLYRNISDETVRNAYKFGINVVVHLLTRYQKYFRFLPMELPQQSSFHGRPARKPTKPAAAKAETNKTSATKEKAGQGKTK